MSFELGVGICSLFLLFLIKEKRHKHSLMHSKQGRLADVYGGYMQVMGNLLDDSIKRQMKAIKYLILILSISLTSCNGRSDGEINIYTKKETLNFKSFRFYNDQNGNLYLNLKNKFDYDKQIIEKIEFIQNEKKYTILPVKMYFSKEFPNSDFIFFRDNLTLKTDVYKFRNEKMIVIWPMKTEYDTLIKSGIIKAEKIDTKGSS